MLGIDFDNDERSLTSGPARYLVPDVDPLNRRVPAPEHVHVHVSLPPAGRGARRLAGTTA